MRKFLMVSHGELSKGMSSMLEIIMGELSNIEFYGAYCDNSQSLNEVLESKVSEMQENDELIIVSDIFGGSVNNEVLSFMDDDVHLIAGMNANLLLSLLTASPEEPIEKLIERSVIEARQGIIYCNDLEIEVAQDDFEF